MAEPRITQSIVALFCEDVREERGIPSIVIGILPDNVTVPVFPSVIPRLSLYVRAHFPTSKPPRSMKVRLQTSWPAPHDVIQLGEVGKDIINKATGDGQKNNQQMIGLILSAALSPFPLQAPGRLDAIVSIGRTDFLAGSVSLNRVEDEQSGEHK